MVRISHHHFAPIQGTQQRARSHKGEGSAAERAQLPEELIEKLKQIAQQGLDATKFGELVPQQTGADDLAALQQALRTNSNARRELAAVCEQLGIEVIRIGVDPEKPAEDGSVVINFPVRTDRGVVGPVEAEILPGVIRTPADLARARREATHPMYAYIAKSAGASNTPGSVAPKSTNIYEYELANYPQEVGKLEDSVNTAIKLLVEVNSGGDQTANLAKLEEILGFPVPRDENGKVSAQTQASITQYLLNQLTERTTMYTNLVKTSGDLMAALTHNLKVA